MSVFLDAAFVGPPSPDDMESIVRSLLWDGKLEAAHAVADEMLAHWLRSGARDATRRFYFWLGIRTATAVVVSAKRLRAAQRRAARKPAALPVSKERRHA